MAESLSSVEKSRDSTANKHPSDTSSSEVSTKLSSDGRGDNEIEKDHREESKDDGPSGGRTDSKAETDQSGASKNNDLSENFNALTISEHGIEEAAHRNETPQQRRDRSRASTGKAKQKLNFDDTQSHHDGKLLDHPWKSEKPSPTEPINNTVHKSEVYTVSNKWLKSCGEQLDLEKIYLDLPAFIDEIKAPSIRKELEDILNSTPPHVTGSTNTTLSPHVLEIAQKQNDVPPNDKPSRPKQHKNNNFKAFTLPPQQDPHQPSEDNYWFLDCEYMLKMYLPVYSLQWFICSDQQGKRIREINPEKKDDRWIFIPSFRRAKIALLEWPKDDIVTQESTIRILVVRPSEFEEYVKYCGHLFPVISLPQDEIGAGYPRYWIQKIALRLKLQFIWMIDDSVECFYEYHPEQKPPQRQDGTSNYTDYRRRRFGLVFERIEDLVKSTKDNDLPIAAMSPKRHRKLNNIDDPFVCKPPRIAVFLNVTALKSKEVYYRPELQVLEDMIFGYECEQNGLKVFMDNRIHLYDHIKWEDTGARSPSVKQKMT